MIARSLRFQLAGAIILIELVMLSLLLFSTLSLLSDTYRERLSDSADNISRQYAATAARYLFESDIPSLAEYSEQVASHGELTSIDVYDRKSNLIYQFKADGAAADGELFVVATDVSLAGNRLGEARLGFSLDVLNASIAQARTRGMVIAGAEILLTIIASFWISGRLTSGLRSLSDAADRYGAGETDVAVEITSNNEIGRTAVAFNRMVEDRREASASLRRSEARFRALVENGKDLILVLSEDGAIRYVSPSIRQIVGHDPENVVGKGLASIFGDDNAASIRARLSPAAALASPVLRDEYCILSVAGAEVHLELIGQSQLDNPDVEGIVLNCWDITDRKLVEEKLRQSAKMEAVGNLTGGLAHDFNNLLGVILGNMELLKEDERDPADRAHIDAAIDATYRAADLTKSMLSFARKATLQPTRIKLNDIVLETKNWSARVLPETIDIETSLLAGLWAVEADLGSTQNALLNLMLNARDAMPKGGKLTIETANVRVDDDYVAERGEDLEPGRYVMLAVSDTGTGIPKDVLRNVFDPFFTTKGPGEGSGLGLSMVQGFMKQSGGTVRVYSEPGEGTTFKLFFRALSDRTSPDTAPRKDAAPRPGSAARILVAEDEPGLMDIVTAILHAAGYDVVQAPTGDAALEVFAQGDGPIDLLLTDIVMPGKVQGPELAKRLRQIDPTLPAVFMSGYANEATVHGNGLRPEDIRLMKPVGKDALSAAIEKALAHRKSGSGGPV